MSVPGDVYVQVNTEGANNATYQVITEHLRGNRAFAVDGDLEAMMYFVQNETWVDLAVAGAFNCTVPACVMGANEFSPGIAGGGQPNPNWAVLQ